MVLDILALVPSALLLVALLLLGARRVLPVLLSTWERIRFPSARSAQVELAAAPVDPMEAYLDSLEAQHRAACLDALTPADLVWLKGVGWTPSPSEVRQLAPSVGRPSQPRPRAVPSDHQRALADEADRRIRRGPPSIRQQRLANEADARIALGEVHPYEEGPDVVSGVGTSLFDHGFGWYISYPERAAKESFLARHRRRVREYEAQLKLIQAGFYGADLKSTPIAAVRDLGADLGLPACDDDADLQEVLDLSDSPRSD